MGKLFRFLRLWYKLLTKRLWLRDNFCKRCGVDIRDFIAPDDMWARVEPYIKHGDTLCYQCFRDICEETGLWVTWHLIGLSNLYQARANEIEEPTSTYDVAPGLKRQFNLRDVQDVDGNRPFMQTREAEDVLGEIDNRRLREDRAIGNLDDERVMPTMMFRIPVLEAEWRQLLRDQEMERSKGEEDES